MKKVDLTGCKYGRLTVLKQTDRYISPSGNSANQWICQCECGNTVVTTTQHLKSGHTKSCGCLLKEFATKNGKIKTHGLTKTRIHRIWVQMKTRCYNSNDSHYPDYGGRGITICDEWKEDLSAFADWAMSHGYADHLTIDRINNNGNYEPSNCRWATPKEQTKNRRNTVVVTFGGISKTLKEWEEETGIKYQTLFYRYKQGKQPCEILKKEQKHNGIDS